MELRELLNILLIGLTLSTVVLTLVVYFIFKIKQGFVKEKMKDKHILEGSFFRRIAPHLEEENSEFRKKIESTQSKQMSKFKISPPLAFSIVFAFIVIFLFLDFLIVRNKDLRGHGLKKEVVTELVKKGLLHEYEYNPDLSPNFFNYYRQEIHSATIQNIKDLSVSKIAVLNRNKKHSAKSHVWVDYLKSLGLDAKIISSINELKTSDILILTDDGDLSAKEIQTIKLHIENGMGLLAVGASGPALDSNFQLVCKKQLPLNMLETKNFTVQAHALFPWSIPVESTLQFKPASSCKTNELSNDSSKLIRSENEQTITYARQLLGSTKSSRIIWVNVLPESAKFGSLEDLFWSQTFRFLLNQHQLRVARWGSGPQYIISIVLVGDDSYAHSPEIISSLKEMNFPFTFFITSDELLKNINILHPHYPGLELANMGEQNTDITKYNIANLHYSVQQARIYQEYYFQQPIYGFRFPNDKFSWDNISPIWQNQFKYILGTFDFSWHEPVPLASDFYYITSHSLELSQIVDKKSINDVADFKKILETMLYLESLRGGHIVLKINPQKILDQKPISLISKWH